MRVAVIGAGPKGLFAVERLLSHAPSSDLAIDLYDPQPPGHGAAYATSQPEHLRLNVNASIVDAGWHDGPAPSPDWVISFANWRLAGGENEPLEPFPPRARVGAYLGDLFDALREHHPGLRHVQRAVTTITRGDDGWLIDGERYDEVLLATGHATDWPGALRHTDASPLVDAVFPIEKLDAIPAGARVVVRGAALTFIDAALALTEGRGGRFEQAEPTDVPAYQPSGAEPAVIWPTARQGRFMEAKPQPGSWLTRLPIDDQLATHQARIRAAMTADEALAQVPAMARQLLSTAGADPRESTDVDAMFAGDAIDADPTEALRRSWRVAIGAAPPSAMWAVGHAWRELYPALVDRFALEAADPLDFNAFADAAGRLERVAFGPPPVNAAKVLSLIDAGIIDPSRLGDEIDDVDITVDAVLPPPGVAAEGATLPGRLVAQDLLTSPDARRGLAIDGDGTCLGPDGSRLEGLAAVGRPTEDSVIGNDTLGRTLHDTTERWAARVARRLP